MNVFLTLTLCIWAYKNVGGQMACRRKLTITKILHPYQFNSYISKGLSIVVRVGRGLNLVLRKAYISNSSLLGSLKPFKHFLVSGLVVGWEVVDGVQSHFSDHP